MLLVGIASFSLVLLSGCVGRPAAKLQEAGGPVGYMFDKIDLNSDGFVDKKEYMAFAQKRYAKFDDNGDGNVTQTEFNESRLVELMPSMAQSVFEDYDANKDGVVTKEEMMQKEEGDFALMESDGDARVTKKEMTLFFKTQRFTKLDSNGDGCVTLEEYQMAKSPFER